MPRIDFKRGDTFYLQCAVTDDDDPQSISGWTIRAQVRDGKTLLAELDVDVVSAGGGTFTLTAEDTEDWPIKSVRCDIQYELPSGHIQSTETIEVRVLQDETLPL